METPFLCNSAIQHGVKYEDVAIYMYELRNDVVVKEYGCIPHKKYSFVGASPMVFVVSTQTTRNM